MKPILNTVVSLLAGAIIGWNIEHYRAQREKTELIHQMVDGTEVADRFTATIAASAIQHLDSGESEQSIRLLSGPVANYFCIYQGPGTNQRAITVRALIEQLAKTNSIVAARIAETSSKLRNKP